VALVQAALLQVLPVTVTLLPVALLP
jgi:hypothetical protein